jgi:peptide/nickel transport system permease protein
MEFVVRPTSRWQRTLDRVPVLGQVLEQPLGALGFAIVAIFLLLVVFGPLIAPYDYATQNLSRILEGPSKDYLLGTDHLGRDLLSRIIYGARIALITAVPAVLISIIFGVILGLLSGYLGGVVDDGVVILLDSIQAFPAVILALAILALLGPSLVNEILVIGIAWIPAYARVTRAQAMSAKNQMYVEAERSLGATNGRILTSHVLPNILAPLLILAAMDLPVVITFEAGLSFLGLGVRPPTPSWGVILSDGFKFVRNSPWPILWAGLALAITTLGFTVFAESLRDVLDPKLSGTRRA